MTINQQTKAKKFLKVLKNQGFYHYAETHTKLFKARNKALEKISGDLVAFLDVDDYWSEIKLERQCDKFKEDDKLDFVFSKYSVVDEFLTKLKLSKKMI